jgi:hypothetical protein
MLFVLIRATNSTLKKNTSGQVYRNWQDGAFQQTLQSIALTDTENKTAFVIDTAGPLTLNLPKTDVE